MLIIHLNFRTFWCGWVTISGGV